MLFEAPCKTGKLQVDETTVRVSAFGRIVWQTPRAAITRINQQQTGMVTVDLTIFADEVYTASMLTKQNAAKFLALFPNINAVVADQVRGREWYDDPTKLTHLATYTNEKAAQKELEAAAQRGWMPQNTVGTAGHINVGRTAAKVALLGPISLVTGASRSKDKITITYVRTPDWLATHRS